MSHLVVSNTANVKKNYNNKGTSRRLRYDKKGEIVQSKLSVAGS